MSKKRLLHPTYFIMTQTALIIIDMQHGMACQIDPATGERVHAKLGRGNQPDAEKHISQLLHAWRAARQSVIHVRHVSRQADSAFQGEGLAFQAAFEPLAHEYILSKHVPDAFCQSELQHYLTERDIKNIVIVGGITNNSVESTARSAGNLGFNTTVVADACFTFGMFDFAQNWRSAQEMHDMTLANVQIDYAKIDWTQEVLDKQVGCNKPQAHCTVFSQPNGAMRKERLLHPTGFTYRQT